MRRSNTTNDHRTTARPTLTLLPRGGHTPDEGAQQPAEGHVHVIQLVGRQHGIAAYAADGSMPLLLLYDDRKITNEDLVPFWTDLEAALATLEARRAAQSPRPFLT